MPLYKCKVIDELGKKTALLREANDEVSLRGLLKRDHYILVESEIVKEKEINVFFSVSSKVKKTELVMFFRQFAVLINSSVSIADSLYTLKQQKYTKILRKVVSEIYNDVLSGKLLSEAFNKHPDVFPKFFIEMVEIGEVSGSLDKILSDMADYYENDNKIKAKAKTSMMYPIILFILINVVIVFMSFVILPNFEKTFIDLGGKNSINGLTKAVFGIGAFIRDYFAFIIIGLAAIIFLIYMFFKSKKGQKTKDYLALHLPFLGTVNKALITSRFTKAFVILLRSGMNITDTMENLKRILDNVYFANKFDYAIEEVRRGKGIAKSLQKTEMFPEILTEMIAVGEKSGNLEEVLSSTTSYYEDEVNRAISRATAALEPMIIIFLGVIVAAVLIAIYIPMIEMMQQI